MYGLGSPIFGSVDWCCSTVSAGWRPYWTFLLTLIAGKRYPLHAIRLSYLSGGNLPRPDGSGADAPILWLLCQLQHHSVLSAVELLHVLY